ncbi:hypothetical protein [Desulfosporosinus sp. Sb-LF]|uniref:hypothetical protein n=1 Tax=Desulfosporosinus sp. Sb-LF TaxID=2560027 RepID=UPI00107F86D0|nr:hypothetical protein [Desulfosporosinus sp. Sb-LF]TGE33307.1 hypothetical protein E4K68_07380 [Desulfosporosinus sp. Sb-LF]
MLNLIKSFVSPMAFTTLLAVLSLILADSVFGVLVSLRNGDFNLSKLPRFVETSLLPYIGGLLVLALFSYSNTALGALFFTTTTTVTAKFLADIVTKATQLFSGIQIQSPITVAQPKTTPAPVTPTSETVLGQ